MGRSHNNKRSAPTSGARSEASMRTPLFVPWLLALVVFAVADTAIGQTARPAAPPVNPKSVELYIRQLTDADPMTRKTAAENLGRMREGARDAIPALVVMLEQAT